MITLQAKEHIIMTCRRHWFIFFVVIAQIALAMAALIVLPFVIHIWFEPVFEKFQSLIYLAMFLALQVMWVVLFLVITDYYLDVWLITNEHLIFIELHGLFSRTISSVNLSNIQDVSVRVLGLLPTLLKFGEIRIQTAGTAGEFIFRQIPRPYEIKDLILKTREESLSSS